MRILIVGAGMAGLTLAAKLRQQGRDAVVIERAPQFTDAGYTIGLWPLGSCVLHGLGVFQDYLERSVESRRYELADHSGNILQGMDLSGLLGDHASMRMLARTELVEILHKACGDLPIRFNTNVEQITQNADSVHVHLSDGSGADFDLVVGCDGIHSKVRSLLCTETETFDTGWTVWTWWGPEGLLPIDLVREYWGRGFFFGGYPVHGRTMFIVGLPNSAVPAGTARDSEVVRPILTNAVRELAAHASEINPALASAKTFFAWPMLDIRAREWFKGRVALCGDSSTAFLPTAGVGASNAIRSAAALADELSKAGAEDVPHALAMYVKRCRTIAEKNQDDSRNTARVMFVESSAIGWGRDQLVKHYPVKLMLKQILSSMEHPY